MSFMDMSKFKRKVKAKRSKPRDVVRLLGVKRISSPEAEHENKGNVKTIRGLSGRYYEILDLIGYGGFGTVHKACIFPHFDETNIENDVVDPRAQATISLLPPTSALDDIQNRKFAIKTEMSNALNVEIAVLLATQGCIHFCELIDVGKEEHTGITFMVMSLLGPSISDMRHQMSDKSFSLSSVIRISIQMLHAIQQIHEVGFIQRDIKPSNFAIGLSSEYAHRLVHMFDFGISKYYLDETGMPIPPRPYPGWRGTIRYCSLNNHLKFDLSRRDDIESWFYTTVELLTGELPWNHLDRYRKEEIEREKRLARSLKRQAFLQRCPPEFDVILTALDRWGFFSVPDYDGLCVYLMRAMMAEGINFSDPYDWEILPSLLEAKRIDPCKLKEKGQKSGMGRLKSVFGPQLFVPMTEPRFVDELRQCQKVIGSTGSKPTSNTGWKKMLQIGSLPSLVTKSSTTFQEEQAHDDFVMEKPPDINDLQTPGDKLQTSLKHVKSLIPKKSSEPELVTSNEEKAMDDINPTEKKHVQDEELWDSRDILPLDKTQSLKSNSFEPIQTKNDDGDRFQIKTNLRYYDGILDTTQKSTLSG